MHTTGRSAALFAPAYGNIAIRGLTAASAGFFATPPPGFAETPLVTPRGNLMIGRADQLTQLQVLRDEVAALSGSEPEMLDYAAARKLVPVLREDYVAAGFHSAADLDLDVDAIHQGYMRRARAAGAELLPDAPVVRLERVGDGWTVRTGGSEHRAAVVIDAAGAWADVVAQMAGARPLGLVPKRRTAMLIPGPDGVDTRAWPAVMDIDEQFYFKPQSGMLLLSPADETPTVPHDAYADEMDIAVAVDRMQQAADIPVHNVARSWAGLRSFFADKTPAVGWDRDVPGFFWLAGQGGYGIQTSPAMGRLSAALAAGESVPADMIALGVDAEPLSPARAGLGALLAASD